MPSLRFSFLGPLEIRCGEQLLLKPPTLKSQSLLAYLVLHRSQEQPREKLAGLFWGDRTERKARRSLATAQWHIRACLGDETFLLSDNYALQVNPGASLWVDVDEFEALAKKDQPTSLQAAIGLYRGMLLEGFYDDWLINRRYQVEALYLEALARLMGLQQASGEPAQALSTALCFLENDPLNEEAYRTAMRAYCALGQRSAALELYRRAEEILQEELGLSPGIETRGLYQAVLEGRVMTGPAPDTEASPILPARARGQHPLETTRLSPLVGRAEELSQLVQAWNATLSGDHRLILIEGEAGVGKTRLVEELAAKVHNQGAWVLPGRCYAFERLLNYQPLVEALSRLKSLLSAEDWGEFPAWVLAEAGRLIPDLPAPETSSMEPPPALEGEQERLFEALTRFLIQVSARRPLLVVLEDLQWATASTLSLLHYLARRLAGQPVLLVGTLRPEPALEALRSQLERAGLARLIQLQPLSEPDFVSLVHSLSGAGPAIDPLARRLFRETEGNPFFLAEISKALFEGRLLWMEDRKWQGDFSRLAEGQLPLPGSLRETILARVEGLAEPAREALRLAAVLGREFDFEPFSLLYDQGDEAAVGVLEALLRSRLVEEGSGQLGRDYAFSHHKIQEVVSAELPRRTRQQLHARAGEALEGSSANPGRLAAIPGLANTPEQISPAELAYHFEQGSRIDPGLAEKAIRYQVAAADEARRLYANQEAIRFYRQALALLNERNDYNQAARTLMKLGLAYHNAFDFPQARQTYQEAFAFWRLAETAAQQSARSLPPAPHAFRLLAAEPPTLDPTRHPQDGSLSILKALFHGLVRQGPQMEILPDVAQSWELLEGGRRYIFHLDRERRWSDGEPLHASDFAAGWRRLLDPSNPADTPRLLYEIRGAQDFHRGNAPAEALGVQALDDVTLLVELDKPCGYFLNLMANPAAFPIPAHQLARFGEAWCRPEHLVTNGAFHLADWRDGEGMGLARSPDVHSRAAGNVERVQLSFLRADSSALALYAQGCLDLLDITFFQPGDLEAARQLYADEYRCLPRLATGFSGFDTSRPPFADRRVRQAFALAIDRQGLASLLRHYQVFPATGGFVPPGMPGHAPGIALPYDPPQARRLLAEAGYPDGRGFPEVISVFPQVSAIHVVGQFIKEQWEKNLSIRLLGQARPLNQFHAGESPHLFNYAWKADYPDPANFLQSSQPLFQTHWRHEEYEVLIESARRCLDQEQRMEIYAQAERILVNAAPLIPLFYLRTHLLVKPWVRNLPVSGGDEFAWKDVILEPHP